MSDVKYHKIKHLVEVEDDILAVFENTKSETDIGNVVSQLRWTVYETDLIRILVIYEIDYSVIVLIK